MAKPRQIQDRGPDSADYIDFDFGEACERERERAEETSTGVDAIGDEDDEATEPFVLMLAPDEDEDTEPALTFSWVPS